MPVLQGFVWELIFEKKVVIHTGACEGEGAETRTSVLGGKLDLEGIFKGVSS